MAICIEFGEAGLAFKAGLVKGALKGLFKGQSGKSEDEQCETRWEEVWKPVCTQHYETVIYASLIKSLSLIGILYRLSCPP